jgi:hypothetical protein
VARTLLDLFPDPKDLLALPPEELGAILLELLPPMMQAAGVTFSDIEGLVFPHFARGAGYDHLWHDQVSLALAEAMAWLEVLGLLIRNPGQPNSSWYILTRRARTLRSPLDLERYLKARTLPTELVHPEIADKVLSLYRQGEYDTAVFQAFRLIEVALRGLMSDCPPEAPAQTVVRKAFHPEKGKLTDHELASSERQALADIFAGAMGHGKNPPGHRDVNHNRVTAARLIIFASHLLEIVRTREMFL